MKGENEGHSRVKARIEKKAGKEKTGGREKSYGKIGKVQEEREAERKHKEGGK